MICRVFNVNDKQDFMNLLVRLNLPFKKVWDNYIWLNKTNYYRLVIFDNLEYGLFTQSQLPIVKAHQELNSANWKDYKPYADKGYKEMKPCGVEAGTRENTSWTPLRKEAFRNSDEWRNFTHSIKVAALNANGNICCEDCGKEFNPRVIEVHHLFPNEYDALERNKFKLLCHECHQVYTIMGL